MNLPDISIQTRVIIGISAMVLLFGSFLLAFISNQRKKIQYHKNLQSLHAKQQEALLHQNLQLEDRVKERTIELSEQTGNLQLALADLKASQQQLLQKEKMASLGEVASGIAHEIQNPLNFVNNFSELNTELLQEIKELMAAENGDNHKEAVRELIEDVIQNLQKINQHGKRADNIVKNLMQHAKTSSGVSELTDVNNLAAENLKLSCHSFRAKDKLIHIVTHSTYDPTLDKIKMVPQDIGRVLLNIYNNAFYAVIEKGKIMGGDFIPTVSVFTKKDGDKVMISIKDNGLGISEKNMAKIFQPFFTTKPTGVGTGLGLSLSYDIIKAHQGELKVNSQEGLFTEFIIEFTIV